jgi:hypothetical protein
MVEKRNPYIIFVGKPEGRYQWASPEKPRGRVDGNIKIHLT